MRIFQGETATASIRIVDDNDDPIINYDDAIVSVDRVSGEQIYRLSLSDGDITQSGEYAIVTLGHDKTLPLSGVYLLNFGVVRGQNYVIMDKPVKFCVLQSNIAK